MEYELIQPFVSVNYSTQAHHRMNSNTPGKPLDSWYVSCLIFLIEWVCFAGFLCNYMYSPYIAFFFVALFLKAFWDTLIMLVYENQDLTF